MWSTTHLNPHCSCFGLYSGVCCFGLHSIACSKSVPPNGGNILPPILLRRGARKDEPLTLYFFDLILFWLFQLPAPINNVIENYVSSTAPLYTIVLYLWPKGTSVEKHNKGMVLSGLYQFQLSRNLSSQAYLLFSQLLDSRKGWEHAPCFRKQFCMSLVLK